MSANYNMLSSCRQTGCQNVVEEEQSRVAWCVFEAGLGSSRPLLWCTVQVKAWCYYESRLLGAHHGLISTYALETLVLYVFNKYHEIIDSPLSVRGCWLGRRQGCRHPVWLADALDASACCRKGATHGGSALSQEQVLCAGVSLAHGGRMG